MTPSPKPTKQDVLVCALVIIGFVGFIVWIAVSI